MNAREPLDVGIDDLNVYGGTLAIEHAAIAAARGLSDHDLRTVEFVRRSVTAPWEDTITLAVNAARPIVETAGSEAFELLIVATESGVDWGKPVSAYVHRHLRLGARCRTIELKHACYAGTAAVQLAAAWVRSGEAGASKALVLMSDLARRHFGTPGELTAGSGAVAVSIAADPGVLVIEPGSGYACREIFDVARPTATIELADPVLSIAAYLDLIEEAWGGFGRVRGTSASIGECFDYMLYHTPLVSLVRQAHGVLLEAGGEDVTPDIVRGSFDRMVRAARKHALQLAKSYSGSRWGMRAGGLDGVAPQGVGTGGARWS
jgi:3-hydroxy-3-methylglutaryl CoA synthase